ncbi:CoA pyrophosphatase [Limoniibacter endophyticus]|uniref:Coenzyme A pyrophosphatase n=1 Tax=Limoniibacter endophyticus TaxID=1565040 RepID=A0A8J3DFW0_9HYPH|nr:CoA pyrophosphatase [Limoniibacter endophyticus]GHC65539.1 coenzyme A pyrophosphatase [Limoniibacter endophyticus]
MNDTVFDAPFSMDEFRRRLGAADFSSRSDPYGDHSLNPGTAKILTRRKLVDAAVLVPVVERENGTSLILTKRTETLRSHSGQIAFPGGRVDPEDATIRDAALRETEEEIGVDRLLIEVIADLPIYVTGSGYSITPVVGVVQPDYVPVLNEDEVADLFEVPLSFLMDASNHERSSLIWQERERFFHVMQYQERYIWGATAGIIHMLYERLYA